uniref:Uncharacterized protein n=1 Tax=Anguilla anguilla TaxID=7936 RepID=A0A0E9UIN8_ANGAN
MPRSTLFHRGDCRLQTVRGDILPGTSSPTALAVHSNDTGQVSADRAQPPQRPPP